MYAAVTTAIIAFSGLSPTGPEHPEHSTSSRRTEVTPGSVLKRVQRSLETEGGAAIRTIGGSELSVSRGARGGGLDSGGFEIYLSVRPVGGSPAQLWNSAKHALRVDAQRLTRSWRYVNRAGVEVTVYVECGSARALSSANAVLATIAGAAF